MKLQFLGTVLLASYSRETFNFVAEAPDGDETFGVVSSSFCELCVPMKPFLLLFLVFIYLFEEPIMNNRVLLAE